MQWYRQAYVHFSYFGIQANLILPFAEPKGPVDPPPVVRLQISRGSGTTNSSSTSEDETAQTSLTSASLIQSPYLFCFAALCKTDSEDEVYLGQDGRTKIVTGNVVSSLYHLRDPKDGSAEGFFVFPGALVVCCSKSSGAEQSYPDIGVRSEGTFRLKFSLYEMVECVSQDFLQTLN
jgi:hypothetical protein